MAWKTLTKVISGTSVQVLSAISIKCRSAFIQAVRGNSNPAYIGDINTATDQGIELIAPQANTQSYVLPLQGLYGNDIDLQNIYVKGSNNEKLTVLYDEF